MRYELALVLQGSLSEEKRKKLLEAVKGLLRDIKITKEESIGEKVLSYPIKGKKSGFYFLLSWETNSAVDPSFEKKLLTNEDILRHLLIRKK